MSFKIDKIALLLFAMFLVAGPAFADEIHIVAKSGDLARVKEIVEKDPEAVNARDIQGATPLHKAAAGGNMMVAEYLVDRGADVKAVSFIGGTPLHAANSAEIALLLLEHGADVNAREKKIEDTPLHSAAWKGNAEVCRILLGRGAEMEAENKLGFTPLLSAASAGHLAVVRMLVERGAEVNVTDVGGWSAIHWSAGMDHLDVAEYLIDHGADVNVHDKGTGSTPLHWTAGLGRMDAVKLLVENGADLSAKDKNNKTPAQVARDLNHKDVAEFLENKAREK